MNNETVNSDYVGVCLHKQSLVIYLKINLIKICYKLSPTYQISQIPKKIFLFWNVYCLPLENIQVMLNLCLTVYINHFNKNEGKRCKPRTSTGHCFYFSMKLGVLLWLDVLDKRPSHPPVKYKLRGTTKSDLQSVARNTKESTTRTTKVFTYFHHFLPSDCSLSTLFMSEWIILYERSITLNYGLAIKFGTHRLEMSTQGV